MTEAEESWCFRIRFRMGLSVKLDVDDAEWVLTSPGERPAVSLKSPVEGQSISEAEQLVLVACGYPSRDAAWSAAVEWRSVVQQAFARLAVGADFGDRAPKGAFTEAGLRWLEKTHAVARVLNDEHGVMVFAEHPKPRFASQSATGVVVKPPERVAVVIARARADGAQLGAKEVLAFDLFGAAFFQPSADARFLMLMMALETLIDQQPRSDEVRDLVDRLTEQVRQSELAPSDSASLIGSLQSLKNESVGQAGRRTAETLGDRKYMNKSAKAFFNECYDVRSALVHGHFPRPTRDEVDRLAANLEVFVGHLISGDLVHTVPD